MVAFKVVDVVTTPLPFALNVTTAPLSAFAPNTIFPLFAVVLSDTFPVKLRGDVIVKVFVFETANELGVAPVSEKFKAAVFEMVTFPVVLFTVIIGVCVDRLILPEPEFNVVVPEAIRNAAADTIFPPEVVVMVAFVA